MFPWPLHLPCRNCDSKTSTNSVVKLEHTVTCHRSIILELLKNDIDVVLVSAS